MNLVPEMPVVGDRIRFIPSADAVRAIRYDGPPIEGIVVSLDAVAYGGGRCRYRIETDEWSPTCPGYRVIRTIYSNDGEITLLARFAEIASDASAPAPRARSAPRLGPG